MYGVELYRDVRLAVVEEGLSEREAALRFGIDRRTVKKMLRYPAPPTPNLNRWNNSLPCSHRPLQLTKSGNVYVWHLDIKGRKCNRNVHHLPRLFSGL